MKVIPIKMPAGVKLQPGFACIYCGNRRRLFRTPRSAASHAVKCIRNPAARSCATCEHDSGPGREPSCHAGVRNDDERIVRSCSEWQARDDEHEDE